MPFDGYDSLDAFFADEDLIPYDDSKTEKVKELSSPRNSTSYESVQDMFQDRGFSPISTWDEIETEEPSFDRPDTLLEKVGNATSRGIAESKEAFLRMRKFAGEAPVNQLLDVMHTSGFISDEDHARITADEKSMQQYRDRFNAALERHPVTNLIGLDNVILSSEEKAKIGIDNAIKEVAEEAALFKVSKDLEEIEATETPWDNVTSLDWYVERIGPEAVKFTTAMGAGMASGQPWLGPGIVAGGAVGAKREEAEQWLENNRPDLSYGERQAVADSWGMVAGLSEFYGEKLLAGPAAAGKSIGGTKLMEKVSDMIQNTPAGKQIARMFATGGAEGLEEVGVGLIDRGMQYLLGDPNAFEGTADSAVLEFAGGAAMGGPLGLAASIAEDLPPVKKARLEKFYAKAEEMAADPEGMDVLKILSEIQQPSRKDLETIGFDKSIIPGSADRARLSQIIRDQVAREQADTEQASAEEDLFAAPSDVELNRLRTQQGEALTDPIFNEEELATIEQERLDLETQIMEEGDVDQEVAAEISKDIQAANTQEEINEILEETPTGPLLEATQKFFDNKKKRIESSVTRARASKFAQPVRLKESARTFRDPLPAAYAAKEAYLKDRKLPVRRQAEHVKVSKEFATRVAREYEAAKHEPDNPEVRRAYTKMIDETMDQWEYVKATGLKVEPIIGKDPYAGDLSAVHKDLSENNHLYFFPTDQGFGQTETELDDSNPMAALTGEKIGDHELRVNDVFRIVHDFFGHGLEGSTFGPRGEENAWQAHVRMYSPEAARAMTTETRGQNSWVNFSPAAAENLDQPGTVYAEQKMTLLPEWVTTEGIAPDLQPEIQDDQTGDLKVQTQTDDGSKDTAQLAAQGRGEQVGTERGRGVPGGEAQAQKEGQDVQTQESREGEEASPDSAEEVDKPYDSFAASPVMRGEHKWQREKGKMTAKPISKKRVVANILDRIDLSAGDNFQGVRPEVKGYYRRAQMDIDKSPVSGVAVNLRRRELADIGVALHEAAHYFDDKLGVTDVSRTEQDSIAGNFTQDEIDFLTRESYEDPGSQKLSEGFAEALRLYVMNENGPTGQGFRSLHALTAFERVLADPRSQELVKFIDDSRADVEQYMTQPLAERIQADLATERSEIINPGDSYFARHNRNKLFRPLLRWLEKGAVNSLRDMEHADVAAQRKFKEWWDLRPEMEKAGMSADQKWDEVRRRTNGSPIQMRLSHSNLVKKLVYDSITDQVRDPSGKIYGDGASKAFNELSQKEMKPFGRYMYAKVALQRYYASPVNTATGQREYIPGEVGIEALEEYVQEIESDRATADKFSKAAGEVTDYFNRLLQMMRDNNLISDSDYTSMVNSHELYMPFYRQFGNSENGHSGKFLGVKAPVFKLRGGSVMPVLDVRDAIVDKTQEVIGAVNRSRIEKAFIDWFEKMGVAGEWLIRVDASAKGQADVIEYARADGVKAYYKVDPDVHAAMSMSGNGLAPVVASVLSVLGKPMSVARNLLVNYSPFFPLVNFPRDLKTAAVKGLLDTTGFDGSEREAYTNMLRGSLSEVFNLSRGSDVDKMYAEDGGIHETRVATSSDDKGRGRRQKRHMFGKKGTREKLEGMVGSALSALEKVNNQVELAPRKAAYHATLRALSKTSDFTVNADGSVSGVVPEWARTQAMFNAQEVTVNFNRRGEWAPYLEPLVLFFNAAMQGSFTSRKQVLTNPKARRRFMMWQAVAFAAKGAALGLMASMYIDDEDKEKGTLLDHYWEIPDYYKKTQDVFLVKWGNETIGISLPKEREWAPLTRLYEEIWKAMVGAPGAAEGDEVLSEAGTHIKEAVGESIPFTGGFLPTSLQFAVGQDWFRGRDIESEHDQAKLVSQRYDHRTTEVAKFISQNGLSHEAFLGGISPKETDFLLRSLGASTPIKIHEVTAGGKLGSKMPFMLDETPRQSMSDFFVKSRENTQHVNAWNAGVEYPESEIDKILEDEATYSIANQARVAIRDSGLSDKDKAKYTTGVMRWALGRKEKGEWPNPLSEYKEKTFPRELKAAMSKICKSCSKAPRAKGDDPSKDKQRAAAKRRTFKKVVNNE